MTEEENKSVGTQVSQADAPATESEVHNERSQDQAEQRKRNDAEHNWAEMRRMMREKDLEIQDLKTQFSQINKKPPAEDEDDLGNLAEDDIVTVAQAKKLAKKLAKNVAEEVIKQREASTVEERIGLKFPDYRDVVTKENIELLKQQHPELASSLIHVPDPYQQAVAAYKMLKTMVPPPSQTLEKKKAVENSQKPVSVQSVTKQSAIGNAHLFENGLTPELKKSLWNEMQQAMKTG